MTVGARSSLGADATAAPIPVSRDLAEPELAAWGEAAGATLAPPALVLLSGPLGAGKTTLVKALCRGLGVEDPVTSPTFALVHEYQGASALVRHLDLHRIETPSALATLGLDELLADDAVTLVEWPERAPGAFPAHAVRVALAPVAGRPDLRRVTVEAP